MAARRRSRRNGTPDSQLAFFSSHMRETRGPMVRAVTAYLREQRGAGMPVNPLLAGLLRAAAFDRDGARATGDTYAADAAGKQLRALYTIVAAEQSAKLAREADGHAGDDITGELLALLGSGPTVGDAAES